MRAFVRKLRSACGETLVETLVAVLVCGLAATLLMTSLGVASSLNREARAVSKQEQVQANNAARFAGYWSDGSNAAASTGKVTFEDKADPSLAETFEGEGDVSVFGGDLIVSYRIEVDGA